jgi:hypothetical protein
MAGKHSMAVSALAAELASDVLGGRRGSVFPLVMNKFTDGARLTLEGRITYVFS